MWYCFIFSLNWWKRRPVVLAMNEHSSRVAHGDSCSFFSLYNIGNRKFKRRLRLGWRKNVVCISVLRSYWICFRVLACEYYSSHFAELSILAHGHKMLVMENGVYVCLKIDKQRKLCVFALRRYYRPSFCVYEANQNRKSNTGRSNRCCVRFSVIGGKLVSNSRMRKSTDSFCR